MFRDVKLLLILLVLAGNMQHVWHNDFKSVFCSLFLRYCDNAGLRFKDSFTLEFGNTATCCNHVLAPTVLPSRRHPIAQMVAFRAPATNEM